MACRILTGDVLSVLPTLPDQSVQCCVTSPPYWGLRDYGVTGQIGLEKTPEEYVQKMVHVFREVRRVLRDDGTLWLNLGDSYARMQEGNVPQSKNRECKPPVMAGRIKNAGLKPKDLVGIPWRVAFSLQSDGWYLRSDIIWHKPNAMPESVTDRCTKSHEYIFMLSKSERYHFDHEAIKEPALDVGRINGREGRDEDERARPPGTSARTLKRLDYTKVGRHKRDVWSVPVNSYSEAHFATFPEDLIEPCILAGCPVDGTVLDPFNGSGTTAAVCLRYGREYVGIELNQEYVKLTEKRLAAAEQEHGTPLFSVQ